MLFPRKFPRLFALIAALAAGAVFYTQTFGTASAGGAINTPNSAPATPHALLPPYQTPAPAQRTQAKQSDPRTPQPDEKSQGPKVQLFTVEPNPVQLCEGQLKGVLTLRWNVTGVSSVEVRVRTPDGPLLARSGPGPGSKAAGDWVSDGLTFFLQNTSGGLQLTAENTLAKVQARVSSQGCGEGGAGRLAEAQPSTAPAAARGSASLRGKVFDQAGSVVVGATVKLSGPSGAVRSAETDLEGAYAFAGLPAGAYKLEAEAQGFSEFKKDVAVASGRRVVQNVKLEVTLGEESVTVNSDRPLNTGTDRNLTTLVLRGQALKALPSNPRAMLAALRALAVPAAGPTTTPIVVDGFAGGRIPPKESIREIRINENPFAAEYDKIGFGVIEIYTKPGTDKLRLGTSFTFNDESLNSRDPFTPERAAMQSRQFGLTLSGPFMNKRASFFLDFQRERSDSNSLVNATVLDSVFSVTPFTRAVPAPTSNLSFNPRFDFQLNQTNTLVARYIHSRRRASGVGIGGFTLPSAGHDAFDTEHAVQLTETAVLGQNAFNEVRFQFANNSRRQRGDSSAPSVEVQDAFFGGGSPLGLSSSDENRLELTDHFYLTKGAHSFKMGGSLRRIGVTDASDRNFNGTFVFSGGEGPLLDAAGNVVRGPGRQIITIPLTSIERYRRTLLFRQRGLSAAQISELGGGPSQYRVAEGERLARVRQLSFAGFVQDDWRVRPNFTLSAGLRYEGQTNVSDRTNFAPRLAFAWAPGAGSGDPKTVLRGGFGLFYDRVGEDLTLQARRYDGISRREFVVTDWDSPIDFPNAPRRDELAVFEARPVFYRVAPDVRAPYSIQSSLSLERQLPFGMTAAATYINTRSLHLLRSRNVNAPLPGTFDPNAPDETVRPFGDVGQIFQYESSGIFRQNQLSLNMTRNTDLFTFYVTYVLNKAMSDTDGSDSFPANSYNLRPEYGRSSLDVRHNVYVGGWFTAPFGIEVYPLVFARSGVPFNITTGEDTNGDTLYTERPAFATDLTRPSVRQTRFGAFDLNPLPGQKIIPRNYGRGPSFFSVNLTLSRSFTLRSDGAANGGATPGGKRPLSMTVSVLVENLLNRTNPDLPVGNLSSPFFGLSQAGVGPFGTGNTFSGNRRVELQVSFHF